MCPVKNFYFPRLFKAMVGHVAYKIKGGVPRRGSKLYGSNVHLAIGPVSILYLSNGMMLELEQPYFNHNNKSPTHY